jgi:hypothetical protein
MALDLTSFAAGLKVHYTDERIENMTYLDNPLFAMVPKMEKFGGKNLPIPVTYGNPQGRSATFATAQANKGSSKIKDFTLTRVSDYSLASISNEAILASMGDGNAMMEAASYEIDGAIQSLTRSLATALFRNGSGSIGQVQTSSFAVTTLTLGNSTATDPDSVANFEVGMVIVVGPNDSSTALRTGTLTISGVDRVAGTVTTSANLSTGISAIAQNDYIFVQGDASAKISGLDAWVPSSVTSSAFFGLDRTADSTRLGGLRKDYSDRPIEEAMIDAASLVSREGGKPDVVFLSYKQWSNLEKALGSKVQYVNVPVSAEIGFRGILINGPRGPIKVVADQNCQANLAWMLQLDTWKLYSLGKAPQICDADGMKMLRDSTADSVEVRVAYYAQLGCRAPGYNIRITLAN